MGEEIKNPEMEEYGSFNDFLGGEATPLLDILVKLSEACVNFSYAAVNVANTNVTETHEIKELLDLVFDIRKLSEKTLDGLEDSLEAAFKIIKEKDCD